MIGASILWVLLWWFGFISMTNAGMAILVIQISVTTEAIVWMVIVNGLDLKNLQFLALQRDGS